MCVRTHDVDTHARTHARTRVRARAHTHTHTHTHTHIQVEAPVHQAHEGEHKDGDAQAGADGGRASLGNLITQEGGSGGALNESTKMSQVVRGAVMWLPPYMTAGI